MAGTECLPLEMLGPMQTTCEPALHQARMQARDAPAQGARLQAAHGGEAGAARAISDGHQATVRPKR